MYFHWRSGQKYPDKIQFQSKLPSMAKRVRSGPLFLREAKGFCCRAMRVSGSSALCLAKRKYPSLSAGILPILYRQASLNTITSSATKMDVEKNLQESFSQQIQILRAILENIHSEQNALINGNLEVLNHIIEQRLELLEKFEKHIEMLMGFAIELATLRHKQLPPGNELNYRSLLVLLKELINVDDVELQYSLDQVNIITAEIEKQNGITMSYLQSTAFKPLECTANFQNRLHIIDGQYRVKPKKVALGLLERDEEHSDQ